MQKKVEKFNKLVTKYHAKEMNIQSRMLDIQSEVGELCKEILKETKYGTKEFKTSSDYEMEFGDVLYALLSLANETNITAEKCLDIAIEKMKARLKEKNNLGSGN